MSSRIDSSTNRYQPNFNFSLDTPQDEKHLHAPNHKPIPFSNFPFFKRKSEPAMGHVFLTDIVQKPTHSTEEVVQETTPSSMDVAQKSTPSTEEVDQEITPFTVDVDQETTPSTTNGKKYPPTTRKKTYVSRRAGASDSPSPIAFSSNVRTSQSPNPGPVPAKKSDIYRAFFTPKLPENAEKTELHGDYHDVYLVKDGQNKFIIKSLREFKPTKSSKELQRPFSASEKIYTVESTIKAYDELEELSSPFVRCVKMLNRRTLLSDGYYVYEFVDGKKANFEDLKKYLKELVQDPKKHHIPDFKPDNVIVPYDGSLPVLIDPSKDDETKWHKADYSELLDAASDYSRWEFRSIDLAAQLRQWYQNDDQIQDLFNEFDALTFEIPGTRKFWEMVKSSILEKINSNRERGNFRVECKLSYP